MARSQLGTALILSGTASTAAGDLTSAFGYLVKSTAADTYSLCTSSTAGPARAVGVLTEGAASGREVSVAHSGGVAKAVCAAACAVQAQLVSSTAGTVTPSAGTAGLWRVGIAITATTAAGQFVEMLLDPGLTSSS